MTIVEALIKLKTANRKETHILLRHANIETMIKRRNELLVKNQKDEEYLLIQEKIDYFYWGIKNNK